MPIASIRLRCILWNLALRPMFSMAAEFVLLLTSKALASLAQGFPWHGFSFPEPAARQEDILGVHVFFRRVLSCPCLRSFRHSTKWFFRFFPSILRIVSFVEHRDGDVSFLCVLFGLSCCFQARSEDVIAIPSACNGFVFHLPSRSNVCAIPLSTSNVQCSAHFRTAFDQRCRPLAAPRKP